MFKKNQKNLNPLHQSQNQTLFQMTSQGLLRIKLVESRLMMTLSQIKKDKLSLIWRTQTKKSSMKEETRKEKLESQKKKRKEGDYLSKKKLEVHFLD